jgi:hypothetical protein
LLVEFNLEIEVTKGVFGRFFEVLLNEIDGFVGK